jgi:archaellum component FlaC
MVCSIGMNDGESQRKNNSLRSEWSILVQSFIEDGQSTEDITDKNERLIGQLKAQGLTFEDLKAYAKHLSVERKSINNQIEDIKNALDSKQQTIENLILVKSDTSGVLEEIEELNDLGEQLSKKMSQIERKAKSLRLAETLFLEAAESEGL